MWDRLFMKGGEKKSIEKLLRFCIVMVFISYFSSMTTSASTSKLFRDDVKAIFQSYKGQMIWIAILSGFLIFLLNILIGVSFYGNAFNASLRDKLGMYFYIKDVPEQETFIYKQVMDLKEKLQAEGLQVDFSTKEDALAFLQKRLPDLSGSFEKF
jgi:hypothetical protein